MAPALSILITWLFLQSNGSVFLAALFHAMVNAWVLVFLVAFAERMLTIATAVTWVLVILLLAR